MCALPAITTRELLRTTNSCPFHLCSLYANLDFTITLTKFIRSFF